MIPTGRGRMVRLDILSDPICPWCYIGKRQLDRALQERPDNPFRIEWHPFQLNPDMPEGGMPRADYVAAKFGDRAPEIYGADGRIATAAREAGLTLNLAAIGRTPNTLDAHRLIHWAGLEGRQTAVVSSLFRAYFEDGRDIGDHTVLLDIAVAAGFDREVVARLLASDADADDIRARDAHARARGVSGVPTFVVAETHVVTGAQPPDLWLKVIDELAGQATGA